MQEIFTLALENGVWAALFCVLFLYQIKDSRSREKKYMETIESLTLSVKGILNTQEIVQNLQKDCQIIKADCSEIKAASKERLKKEEDSYEL